MITQSASEGQADVWDQNLALQFFNQDVDLLLSLSRIFSRSFIIIKIESSSSTAKAKVSILVFCWNFWFVIESIAYED